MEIMADLLLALILLGGHGGRRVERCSDVRPLASVSVELALFLDEVRQTGADRRREIVVQLGTVEHRAASHAHHPLSLRLAALLSHFSYSLGHLSPYAAQHTP